MKDESIADFFKMILWPVTVVWENLIIDLAKNFTGWYSHDPEDGWLYYHNLFVWISVFSTIIGFVLGLSFLQSLSQSTMLLIIVIAYFIGMFFSYEPIQGILIDNNFLYGLYPHTIRQILLAAVIAMLIIN